MSTDRDTTRIVRSWLEEGVTALPDRVLDAVLDQLPATSQRRPWWPARRFREMNQALKLAIAAAAVVVVALVGINLMPGSGVVGGPAPSLTPSPSPTPTPPPSAVSNLNFTGATSPGRHASKTRAAHAPGRTLTISSPGWYAPLEAWRIGQEVPAGSDLFDCLRPRISSTASTPVAAVGRNSARAAVGPTSMTLRPR